MVNMTVKRETKKFPEKKYGYIFKSAARIPAVRFPVS